MAAPRVAVVTGANKGIGFQIVRSLILRYPKSPLAAQSTTPFLIYLTSRDRERGERAVKSLLNEDEALRDSKLLYKDGGPVDVRYKQLDVSEPDGVNDFVFWLQQEHKEGMDILVNNAGVSLDGFDSQTVSTTLTTNYHAPLSLSLQLLPLLRLHSTPSAPSRLINMSSLLSKLSTPKYSPSIISAFRAAVSARSISDISALMDGFSDAVAVEAAHPSEDKAKVEAQGWPRSAYAVSKAGLTAFTQVLGREELRNAQRPKRGSAGRGQGAPVLINACCPGYVSTDMTKNRGRKTAEQGAEMPVQLALDDLGGVGGEFWERGKVSTWDIAEKS